MSRKQWIALIATALLTIVFAVFLVVHYLNDSNFIRNRILAMTGELPGDLQLDAAVFRFSSLTLHGLQYASHDSTIAAYIGEVRLQLEYPNLFQRPFRLQNLIREISILQPDLVVRLGEGGSSDSTRINFKNIKQLDHLNRFIIQNGRVALVTRADEPVVAASKLNGWLHMTNLAHTIIGLSGQLYQDTSATFSLSGNANLLEPGIRADFQLDSLDLSYASTPTDAIGDVAGKLGLHLRVSADSSGWSGAGAITLHEGALQITKGPYLDGIRLNAELQEQDIRGDGRVRFEGDPITFNGYLTLRDVVQAEAFGHVKKGRLGKHLVTFAGLKPHEAPVGTMEIDAHLLWKPSEGIFRPTAHVTSDSMQLVIGPIRDIQTDLEWVQRNHRLRFNSVRASWYGMEVTGKGVWRPKEHRMFNVNLHVRGLVNPAGLPQSLTRLNALRPSVDVSFSLTGGRGWLIEGNGLVNSTQSSDIADFSGWYTVDAFDATLQVYSQPRFGKATFRHKRGQPYRWSVSGPQFLAQWYNPEIQVSGFLESLTITGEVDSDSGRYRTRATVRHPETGIKVSAFGMVRETVDKEYHGLFSYNLARENQAIANGDFDFTYQKNIVQVERFIFKDYIRMSGGYNFAVDRFDTTTIQIDELDLHDVISRASLGRTEDWKGYINGKITLAGSIKQPFLEAVMELHDGSVGRLGGFWALLSAVTDSSGDLRILRGEFGREGNKLFGLAGGYHIPKDSLHVRFSALNTNAAVLGQGILGDKDLFKGNLDLHVDFSGNAELPSWESTIGWTDAELAGVAFDSIAINLLGSTNRRLGHVIRIRQCEMINKDEYTFRMAGAIPVGRSAGLVAMNLEGKVLKVLPQLSSFIEEADGEGSISTTWTVVGGKQFIIGESTVSLRNGSLRFQDILKPINDLEVELTLDQEGMLTIDRLQGMFNSSVPFEIANLPVDSALLEQKYYPVHVDAIGLKLGILFMRTSGPGGLPLRLAGVNPRGEFFSLALRGKSRNTRLHEALQSLNVGEVERKPGAVKLDDTSPQTRPELWFTVSGPAPFQPLLAPSAKKKTADTLQAEGAALEESEVDSLAELMGLGADTAFVDQKSHKDQLKAVSEFQRVLRDVRTALQETGGEAVTGSSSKAGLLFTGAMVVSDFRGTFPPEKIEGAGAETPGAEPRRRDVIERLFSLARWDVDAYFGQNVTYVRDIIGLKDAEYLVEFQGFIDRVSVEARVDPTEPGEPLSVTGAVEDNTLRLLGDVRSTSGTVDFLDQTFRIEEVSLEFDRSDVNPVVSGRAAVDVLDRLGFPQTYYLTMFIKDPETGQKQRRGRWGKITFGLEDDLGSTQEAILDSMGYSARSFQEEGRLSELGGTLIERELMRRWIRPVERDLARFLGLSHVRFDPMLAQNLFAPMDAEDLWAQGTSNMEVALAQRYTGGSRLTLGKYVTKDLYVSYTGQIGRQIDYETPTAQGKRGYLQTWNATYRMSAISPNLVLDTRWEYDSLERLDNRSVRIRYTFSVEE